jgi:4-hydroxy-tetrahydrodipicolinate synthase
LVKIDGVWTALVSPVLPDLTLDRAGLERNIEFQIAQGITGVVPTGTTGESPTLDWNEHNEIIDRALTQCKGRCGVLAGTGSNSTAETLENTARAAEHGAEGVLLVDCYYNGPSSQELRDEYYGVVASKFPNVTVVPYVIPGRSGTALAVEDLAILAHKYPNISAVKEATGDLDRMAKTRSLLGDAFSIISGDDDITHTMMTSPAIRANGTISVMSNVIPGALVKMARSIVAGDLQTAAKIRDAIAPLLGIVTVKVDNERMLPNGQVAKVNDRYRNPLAVKTLMAGLGMPSGACRRPLGKMSRAGVDVVRSAVKQVWEHNPETLQPICDFFGVDVGARIGDDSVWATLAR